MLEAQDLAARRGTSQLYEGLSFSVRDGVALVVTGANGRGKTTLLRALAGLSEPAAGTIRLDGEAVRPFAAILRRAVAFAGHAAALKDELTARENLASLAALAGADPSPADIDAALDRVALGPKRSLPARVLYQGQRRRIGLARLALVRRRLWILDEPVTALDAEGTALLAGMLDAHLAGGGMAVAATHAPLAVDRSRIASLSLD
ncbi:MAG: cytochrome c biogenesis heme-transporting ATPase CcmA [Burkholderiales bacterium]|nr:cytochrome c biogenesis heme-transporting ATPase CcmA [Burkholderiales bacterium]